MDGSCYFTNRLGVKIHYRAVIDRLGDIQVYRFEIAPAGNPWRRSSAFFWTEREAFNTARDIARDAARFDAVKLSFTELPPQRTPAEKPRDVIKPHKPAVSRPLPKPMRPAAPIRQYKDD